MDLDQWVHLAAVIDEGGELSLLVNAWPVTESQGSLLARTPVGPLSVGADVAPLVGEYGSPLHWQGLLQDARVCRAR